MELAELKQELLNFKVRPTYVFCGDELALQDVYIDKIQEISKLDKVRVEDLKIIYNKIGAKTLIKTSPKLYLIRGDNQYLKEEGVWDKLINGKGQKGNIIIFLYPDLDKRGKFYKAHENILIEFHFLSENVLSNRLQAVTHLPSSYCKDLVKMCGCNYGRIKNELYKLGVLAKIENYNLSQAYLEAKRSNMIHEEIGDVIFDFTNAVIERNVKNSYKYLKQLNKLNEEGPVKLVTVLYNSFRNVLLVQSTSFNERTEEILGISKGQIYMTSQKCDHYTLFELVDILKLLQKVEKGIKIGQVDSNYVMEYILAQIF